MNNHGWGLRVMLGFCCVVALCVIIVAVAINKNFKEFSPSDFINNLNNNNNKPGKNAIIDENQSEYRKIEGDMIKATESYLDKYYSLGIPLGTRLTITIKSLQRDKLLDKIYDPINNNIRCSGYINVLKDSSLQNYQPYLKCGNRYETDGYVARLDDIG